MEIAARLSSGRWIRLSTEDYAFEIKNNRLQWQDKGDHCHIDLGVKGLAFFPFPLESESGQVFYPQKWDTWRTEMRCRFFVNDTFIDTILPLRLQAKRNKPGQNAKNWRIIVGYYPFKQADAIIKKASKELLIANNIRRISDLEDLVTDIVDKLFRGNREDQSTFISNLRNINLDMKLDKLDSMIPLKGKRVINEYLTTRFSNKNPIGELTTDFWEMVLENVLEKPKIERLAEEVRKNSEKHQTKREIEPLELQLKKIPFHKEIPETDDEKEFIVYLIEFRKRHNIIFPAEIVELCYAKFGKSPSLQRKVYRYCKRLGFQPK